MNRILRKSMYSAQCSQSIVLFLVIVKGRNEKFCQMERFGADLLVCQRPVDYILDPLRVA